MYDRVDSGWPFYCITNRNGEGEGNAKIERNRCSIEWFFVIERPQETAKIPMVKTLSVDGGLFPKFQSYFSSIRSFRAFVVPRFCVRVSHRVSNLFDRNGRGK